ncbi:hypothetical protein VNO80_26303 [Phaseolus coccineus]|uniref:Uncharacterized protein n=1 Tax=Phaseolus coccineus TaxID=3886 RepID=A0AAN9LER2_PHACN
MKKRGDMVWVRFHLFHHKWLPALVLSSDNLGVNVTFSFTKIDAVSPTSYFLHSQVLPFEEAFPFLTKRDEADLPLLHSALRFFGRRIVSGLQCRCLTGFNGPVCSSGFDPAGVLGFVLDAAVSPWVELPSFARAVRVVAQVHAFRSCCSMKHKKLYKQTKIAGDNAKLIPSSVLGQKMHLVTQGALESQEKCQIVSKNQQSKKVIGAIKRLNSMVPIWEGNSAQLFKNGDLIISESFMVCPSLDPLYMVLESLKSSRHSLLGFKKISDRGLVDICFENFSTMSKTHILVPSNFMIHLRNFIDKIEDNVQELCWRLPDKEIIISFNRKRRRLDKSASCHFFPQISGVQESERDAYIPKHTRPRISDIKILEPEGSIQKGNEASTYVCEDNMNLTGNDKVQKVDSKRSQNCELLSNLVFGFHSDKCEVDASERERDAYIPKHTRPRISDIKMLEPEGSIKKGNEASTYVCEDNMNFTGNDKVQKVDSKRSQNCELLSNLVSGFHSDKCEVDASAAKGKGMLGSDSSVYQESQQMSCISVTTTPRSEKFAGTELFSEGCLVEGKNHIQGVASCSIFNSKVGKSSKTHVPSSKSLHMKFPRNFNLPSKEQLVKKFSVFGSVDSSRTRVFCYRGSAQVCFLQEADTVVAYKYAKRKALFGTAEVQFWLDPFEHKRRGFECSTHVPPLASKQTGPPLKSCLKKANTLRKENRKKKRRVRFTIET